MIILRPPLAFDAAPACCAGEAARHAGRPYSTASFTQSWPPADSAGFSLLTPESLDSAESSATSGMVARAFGGAHSYFSYNKEILSINIKFILFNYR